MMDAGVPLVQCLGVLGEQEKDARLASAILAVRAEVEGGSALADAMRRHPGAFDGLYTNMIAAGESGGILRHHSEAARGVHRDEGEAARTGPLRDDLSGRRNRDRGGGRGRHPLEGNSDLRRAVRGDRRYAALADPTGHRSQRLVRHPAAGNRRGGARRRGGATVVPGDRAWTTPGRRRNAPDTGGGVRSFARSPWPGSVARCRRCSARECRFSMGWRSRGPGTAGNAVVEGSGHDDAVGGSSAASRCPAPWAPPACFRSRVVHMIAVGESTGALDAMLAKVADICEEDVDASVAGLMTLLEPILIAPCWEWWSEVSSSRCTCRSSI